MVIGWQVGSGEKIEPLNKQFPTEVKQGDAFS